MLKRQQISKGKGGYSGKTILSNITTCECCGKPYQLTHWYAGGHRIVWCCATRLKAGRKSSCKNRTISDEDLKNAVSTAINKFLADKAKVIARLEDNIKAGIITDVTKLTAEIDEKIEALQKQLVEVMNEGRDSTGILKKLNFLDKQKNGLLEESSEEKLARQKRLLEYLTEQGNQIEEYDDMLTRRLVDSVVIGEKKMVVTLKTGITVEV